MNTPSNRLLFTAFSLIGLILVAAPAGAKKQAKPAAPEAKLAAPEAKPTGTASAEGADFSGEPVVQRFIDALGGAKALDTVKTMRVKATMTLSAQNLKGEVVINQARPDRLLMSTTIPGVGLLEQGFDGATAWAKDPILGPRLLEGPEADQVKQQGSDLLAFSDLRAHYKSIKALGPGLFDDRLCDRVELVMTEGMPMTAYYDQETGLQIGAEMRVATPMGEIPSTTYLGNYKEFGKVKMATTVRQQVMGTEQLVAIHTVEINPAEMPSFRPPDEIGELLSKK